MGKYDLLIYLWKQEIIWSTTLSRRHMKFSKVFCPFGWFRCYKSLKFWLFHFFNFFRDGTELRIWYCKIFTLLMWYLHFIKKENKVWHLIIIWYTLFFFNWLHKRIKINIVQLVWSIILGLCNIKMCLVGVSFSFPFLMEFEFGMSRWQAKFNHWI